MYNLLVSNLLLELAEDEPLEIARARYLEYTSETIKAQLFALSNEAIAAITSWPTLVMAEGRGEETAFATRITHIAVGPSEIAATLQRLPTNKPVLNDGLWKARGLLDIEQFEFSRHHWAVKDRNLVEVLHREGIEITDADAGFDEKPLPAPPRGTLLQARTVVGDWGHTEIDDFLLEAGVEGLEAGRELGSRRDRANAILRYILENPSSTTAENHLLSAFFARAAGVVVAPAPASANQVPTALQPSTRALGAEEPRPPKRVFVVHGRDEKARQEVVEFLRQVGLEAIVLHQQPNMGRHLLTKFIDEAELVTFAVVLMTADDVGGISVDHSRPRARQNVILELGYFLSHLGQPRVCALITPGLETPSDFDGVVYIEMSENGHWKLELQRELIAARMPLRTTS
jgi:predicted nucleotide-binding protein